MYALYSQTCFTSYFCHSSRLSSVGAAVGNLVWCHVLLQQLHCQTLFPCLVCLGLFDVYDALYGALLVRRCSTCTRACELLWCTSSAAFVCVCVCTCGRSNGLLSCFLLCLDFVRLSCYARCCRFAQCAAAHRFCIED